MAEPPSGGAEPPVPPSTHLLCPHLAPRVDDAGLPAAVAQQVLPQVAAGLLKALQRGESSVTSSKTAKPPRREGTELVKTAGSLPRWLGPESPCKQQRGREMGMNLVQKHRCPPAPGEFEHQQVTGLSGTRLSLHPLGTPPHGEFQAWPTGIF